MQFDNYHDALEYIKKYKRLTGYKAYFCDECGKWHIGFEENERISAY